MSRFCLTLAPACVLAGLACFGCTGEQIQGAWYGALPLASAQDCRIRLMNGGRFDVACHGPDQWVGQGAYKWDGSVLTLKFDRLLERGEPALQLPAPIALKMDAKGNEMCVQNSDLGCWERKMP